MTYVEVIAEIGVNPHGSVERAKFMIDDAKQAGATFVKFQYFKVDDFLPLPDARLKTLLECEFALDELRTLKDYAEGKGLGWFATPMKNIERIDEYMTLKPQIIKVREADSRDEKFVEHALSYHIPTIISVDPTKGPYTRPDGTWLMYVNPHYPPRPQDFEVSALKHFDGFSNHFPDTLTPKLAVGSAWLWKKHFFWLELHLKNKNEDVDAPVSLDKAQFKEVADYAHSIRNGLGLE